MNRKIRIALYTFIALSVFGLVVAVYVHQRTQNAMRVTFTEDKKLEVRIDRIHYSGTKQGRKEWEFEADYAKRAKDDELTVFSNVRATYYPEKGPEYTLKAKEGRYWEAKGLIHVIGAVSVEAKGRFTLETEKLELEMAARKISTSKRVTLKSGLMDIRGTGLIADVDNGNFRILSDVRAVIN